MKLHAETSEQPHAGELPGAEIRAKDPVLARYVEEVKGDADPSIQQGLEAEVERLLSARGIQHEWGDDLEPLKAHRFGNDA